MSGIEAERCGEQVRDRLDGVAADLRERRRALRDQQIDLARDEIGHRRACAAIGMKVSLVLVSC